MCRGDACVAQSIEGTTGMATNVTTEKPEYDQRVERVRAELETRQLDALVLFHPIRMAYVSGFFHLSTERQMAIVVPASGGLGALIPQLEQEHIAKSPGVTSVKVYPEYP